MAQIQPKEIPLPVTHFTFCYHPDCSIQSRSLLEEARSLAGGEGMQMTLEAAPTACRGVCSQGPFVGVPQMGFFYQGLGAEGLVMLFGETARQGMLIFEHLAVRPTEVTDPRLIFNRQERYLVLMSPVLNLADAAAYLFAFNAAESCGKCTPCRMGVPQVATLLNRFLGGRAQEGDLEKLEGLTWNMGQSAYCEFAGKVTSGIQVVLEAVPEAFTRGLDPEGLAGGFTGGALLDEDPAATRGQFNSVLGLENSYALATRRALDIGSQHSGPGSLHPWGGDASPLDGDQTPDSGSTEESS